MTQTERASLMALFIMSILGGPFIVIAIPAMIGRDLILLGQLWPFGYLLVAFCVLVVFAGVWLDNL